MVYQVPSLCALSLNCIASSLSLYDKPNYLAPHLADRLVLLIRSHVYLHDDEIVRIISGFDRFAVNSGSPDLMLSSIGLTHLLTENQLHLLSIEDCSHLKPRLNALSLSNRSLAELNLSGCHLLDQDLCCLRDLCLQRLNLSRNPITDHGLKLLLNDSNSQSTSISRSLTALSLSSTRVKTCESLPAISNLLELDVSHTFLTNRACHDLLQNLATLQSFNASTTRMQCLDALPYNLRSLDLSYTRIDDFYHIPYLPKLATLSLRGLVSFSDSDLKHLLEMKQLQKSDEHNSTVDDFLEKCTFPETLTSLDLSGTAISDIGISHLSHATPNLQSLSLCDNTQIRDCGSSLSKLLALTSLNLFNTSISRDSIRQLTNLNALTSLNLGRTGIPNDAHESLQQAIGMCLTLEVT